jgi:hypothetical protein
MDWIVITALITAIGGVLSAVLVYFASTRKADVERLKDEMKVMQGHQQRCENDLSELRDEVLQLLVAAEIKRHRE